jgi:hypothetical protein
MAKHRKPTDTRSPFPAHASQYLCRYLASPYLSRSPIPVSLPRCLAVSLP